MQLLILMPVVLILFAAILWHTQAQTPASVPPTEDHPQPPKPDPRAMEALTEAVAVLQELMEHPVLGGPGFLTVRVCEGSAVVTVQYPNIQEGLYRRIIRQELSPAALLPEGVPELLLELSPEFETESGGMVLVTVEVPGLRRDVSGHHSRQMFLNALAAELRLRFPGMSVRVLGGELILTPLRSMTSV